MGSAGASGAWLQSTRGDDFSLNYPLLLNPNGGNVGIGTTTPNAKLTVVGAIQSQANVIATGGAVDLSLSNTHVLQAVGGTSINLTNPTHGTAYTLIVSDTNSRTYTFSGCTTRFSPANAATTAGTETIYGITTVNISGTWYCYITWSTGFQ